MANQEFDEFTAIFEAIYAIRTSLNKAGSSLTKEKEPEKLATCYELTKMMESDRIRELYAFMRDNGYDMRMSDSKQVSMAMTMAKLGGIALHDKWHIIMIAYDNMDMVTTQNNFNRLFR